MSPTTESPQPSYSFRWQRRGEVVTGASSNVSFICLSKCRHYRPFLPHSKWETEAQLMQFGNWREMWGMERRRCQSSTIGSQEHHSFPANYEPQHKRLEIWVLWQGMKKLSTRLKIHLKKISTEDNSVTWNLGNASSTGHKQREKKIPRG